MKRSEGSFLALLLLLVLLALPLPAIADKPIKVGDGTAASCTEAALANALAIAEAVGGGTIKFHCGDGAATIPVTATLAIPDNTTINGGGTITLVGDADVLVAFVAVNSTVALKGLVISSAAPPCTECSGRGGVHNEGTLTIHNTTFSGIKLALAGALTNLGTATVTNSTFRGNLGFGDASGIVNRGTLTVNNSTFSGHLGDFGGAILNSGTATVKNSTFSDSFLQVGAGGGIANVGTLAVKNCRFSLSRGAVVGGGIYSSGTLTVENSTFSPDDNANGSGGGLFIGGGFASVRHSVFSGNLAPQGGGIANFATLELINSTVSDNTATLGGGIFNAGTLDVINSRVFGNAASQQGGGIFNLGTLLLNHSIITDNTAIVGGGVYNCLEGQIVGTTPCHGTLTLQRTTVTENTPDNIFPW